jgi:hypothetical protein
MRNPPVHRLLTAAPEMISLRVRSLAELSKSLARYAAQRWARIADADTIRNLEAIAIFSVLGFLLALNLTLWFPDHGILIEQYNQY